MGRIFHIVCDNPMCHKDDTQPHSTITENALRLMIPGVPDKLIAIPNFYCRNCFQICCFEMEETSVGKKT